MSRFAGFIVGAIEIGIGLTVPGAQALVVAGIGLIVSQAIVDLTMPKGNKSRNASETELQLGEVARKAAVGRCSTGGSLVDAFNYGGKYGTDHEVVVFALCDHEIEELEGVYVNDVFVEWAGDGNYPQFDDHHLSMYFRPGTEGQSVPSVLTDHGPGWTSSDNGAGIAFVVVDYLADQPDAKHPAWPGGRPSFQFVLKGAKLYDPRNDDTVPGGGGPQRRDDPATWTFSENPIIQHYNYMLGFYACNRIDQPSQLLVGRGLTTTEIPPQNIFAAANLCDEEVETDVRRYISGGIISADEKYIDVAEKFAAAVGGVIIQPGGSVEIEPAQAKIPSFTVTDDDIIVGSTVEYNQGILSKADNEWLNTIVAQYVEPKQKWSDQSAPVRRVTGDVILDGESREENVTLQYVTVERQASEIAEIHRKLGRLFGRMSFVLGPRFAGVEEGDWGRWISARYGVNFLFRAESYGLNEKWQNAIKGREINADVYDGHYAEGEATGSTGNWDDDNPSPPPDIGEPDAANWDLAAVTLTSSGIETPALEITGDATDDTSAEAIIFEYWPDDGVIDPIANPDDPTWSVYGTLPRSTTKVDITSIQGGQDYYTAVTYFVGGIRGDRLVLGPVTAASIDISGAVGPLLYMTIDTVSGTTYTIDSTDSWHHKRFTNASAITVTVPTNASEAYPIGGRTRITQAGTGQITLSPAGGVTLNSRDAALKSFGQKAVLEIEKVATDEWDVLGDVTT